ncbi:uncharacterized protein LOC106152117 [Lingula anatina]|uniref:Uncharacterized protein LOC106152117 n=1 Tax=Lingula anatina TaxID=7574 RepID=A0A1S3H6F8_LINAN|nr:uncharacterized protein LOC106152117 [Lingula anatina]|eukprot:XP_013381066.1 uncharacterized protein LOC106152117 [Lingula anatina]
MNLRVFCVLIMVYILSAVIHGETSSPEYISQMQLLYRTNLQIEYVERAMRRHCPALIVELGSLGVPLSLLRKRRTAMDLDQVRLNVELAKHVLSTLKLKYLSPGCQNSSCLNSSCQNGGSCIKGPGDNVSCACPTGYTGEKCEIRAAPVACTSTWLSTCKETYGTGRCSFICPIGCINSGTVWGTGNYTGDSRLCRAAIHDGRMPAAGGVATVVGLGPLQSFRGTTQNGVTTASYGSYGTSFRFV